MKKILRQFGMIAILTAGIPSLAVAQMTPPADMPAGTYNSDLAHTSLIWKVSHAGLSDYTARFTDVQVKLDFDPAHFENSKLEATINPASIQTAFPYLKMMDFDKELSEGEQWLNNKKFPEIKFVSTKIEKTTDNTAIITGNLTFLGISKPASLNVTFNGAMADQPFSHLPTLGFSANGIIKRSEWGLKTYIPVIGDDVEILIETELAQQK